MAVIGSNSLTLQDWASRYNDKKIDIIVEILSLENQILDDMMWMEGNTTTVYKTTIRSGLPTVAWRLLNYGVQPSKSKTVQVTDTCGNLEAFSKVDKDLADLNGNKAEFRLSEDRAFLEAMSQEMATTLIYGSTVANLLGDEKSVIAVGRVMSCVLAMIVEREREIRNFVKTSFYKIIGGFCVDENKEYDGEWKAVETSKYYETFRFVVAD